MNIDEVFRFMDRESLAVLATVTENGQLEAALMGFAVTPQLEIVFDTVKSSRKYPNLKNNPRIAWVIGCTTEVTVQYEGVAEELEGEQLSKYKRPYFSGWPSARKLAGNYVFCHAPDVGALLRLQSANAAD